MPMTKIACCTDFSPNADSAFLSALELAEKYKARLYLIHVLPPALNPLMADTERIMPDSAANALIPELQEQMASVYGERVGSRIDYKIVVLDGHISTEIIRYLEKTRMDLVVMGSYGLSGVNLVVFGSVAKRVVHKSPCSVLIVRMPKTDHGAPSASDSVRS